MPGAEAAAGALWHPWGDANLEDPTSDPTAEPKRVKTHFEQYKNIGGTKLFRAKFQFPLWRW